MSARSSETSLRNVRAMRQGRSFIERAIALRLRSHVLTGWSPTPHSYVDAMAEMPAGIAAARTIGRGRKLRRRKLRAKKLRAKGEQHDLASPPAMIRWR